MLEHWLHAVHARTAVNMHNKARLGLLSCRHSSMVVACSTHRKGAGVDK